MLTDKLINKFFTGINYWGSESAINMWRDFNISSIENDLKLLKDAGITHLRIFPLWSVFQPLCALYGPSSIYEYSFGEEPLPDTPAGQAGVSEEACQKFDAFCNLAEKYEMNLIVALITGHMSFRTYNPPAFDGKALLSDPTVIKWQIRFVKYFVNRFKDKKAILGWDLGNEPIHMPGLNDNPDTFYVWCSTIANAVKACDQVHPVISGLDESEIEKGNSNLKSIGEICDAHTMHPYNIFQTPTDPVCTMKPTLDISFKCKLSEDIAKIPTFVQEFGSIGYMNCSYKTEADFYRASLYTSLAHGCHGTMWWCAFDQGHFEYAPYRWNTIGSEYGFFDKDYNEKPIADVNRNFKKCLDCIPDGVLPPHITNGTIVVPRDDGTMDIHTLRASYMLAKQANIDMNFCYALDKIPDSPLYIFPSISGNKSIDKKRFNEILEKVKNGSVLYISADTGLIREIPQTTGVSIAYREQINSDKIMMFGKKELPIKTEFFLMPESSSAEVIATDENGNGVFFKNKYGKGYVYFLTLPLEKYLANKSGAFFNENQPPYDLIYRELAKASGVSRIADSSHPYIRLTEHKINDNSYYIFAINYSNKKSSTKITVDDNFNLTTVFGKNIINDNLTLDENDGALFKAVKK